MMMILGATILLLASHLVASAPTVALNGTNSSINRTEVARLLGGGRRGLDLGDGIALLGCAKSEYSCKVQSFRPKCIGLEKLCDGVKDCPSGEDETNKLCMPDELREALRRGQREGTENDFSGTGFMFSVNNLVVSGGSRVKMFNQESDNTASGLAKQVIVNRSDGGQGGTNPGQPNNTIHHQA